MSSAAAFLNNQYALKQLAPNPTTERGVPTVLNVHPKENKIIYPAGKYIVVRNLDSPGDNFIYRGHAHPTTVAKFSHNGFWVASGDISGKVRIWSWDHPEHLLKIEIPVFSGPVLDLDWDFEAKKIVAVGEGGQFFVKCFTWDTGNSVGEMVGHTKKILSVSFKKSRPFKIMTGSMDFGTIFYAGPPFKMDHSNNVHTNFVNCVRYSPDGSKLVSVASDKKVVIYDGVTGQPTGEIPDAHGGSIYSVAFNSANSKFVTASGDKTVKVWDLATLSCENSIDISAEPQIGDMQNAVVWNESGIVSLSLNGNLNVLNPANSTVSRVFQSHQTAISSLFVDSANNQVITGSLDGVVCAHNIDTFETTRLVSQDKKNTCGGAHSGKVAGITSVNGEILSVGWDDSIRFANAESLVYTDSVSTNGQPCALASSEDVFGLVTNSEISIYSGKDKIASLGNLSYTPTCISLCGRSEVAVGGDDSKTHVYSIDGNKLTEITTIPTRSPVSAVSYSPNSDVLAIGDNGRQVEVYERGSWTPKIQGLWVFHTSKITTLKWSPNGNYLASGSLDENIFVWNLSAPKKKIQFQFSHMGGVTCLGWIGDDKLVSSGNDLVVVFWRVPLE